MTHFVVIGWCDQIKQRTDKAREREVAEAQRWGRQPDQAFTSHHEACDYIISRAVAEVVKAEKELLAARRRLARCQRKFGAATVTRQEGE